MLKAEQLHKRYGAHTAIHALDLHVPAGDVYALLGPNGAGKTTTINCFLGFLRPDGGRVLINGHDPAIEPEATRRQLAYIPEQVNLYGWFTGVENLAYFAELGGRRLSRAEAQSLLDAAGLQTEAFDKPVGGYSKGMRQKVGIAIAMAKQARVLLLDEPTSGLDPRASYEFSRLAGAAARRGYGDPDGNSRHLPRAGCGNSGWHHGGRSTGKGDSARDRSPRLTSKRCISTSCGLTCGRQDDPNAGFSGASRLVISTGAGRAMLRSVPSATSTSVHFFCAANATMARQ